MSLPALRFKEFNGEWVAKKLSDVASRIGDGLHSTPVYDESGDYYFVNGNNLTNNKIEINESTKRLNNSEYLKHKVELSSKSILMSINGTIGNLAFFNNEPVVLGKSACYINLKADENKHFVFNLLQTSNIKSYFDKELTGSTIKNLSLTTIKNTSAYFPCHEEQTKIANFLTAVDEKITQLTQKSDLLAQYKKGVMQKIFSQELRFKDDDGREFPDWEVHVLADLSDVRDGTHDSPKFYSEGYPLITSKNLLDSGRLDLDNVSLISEEDFYKINKRSKVDCGDILFGMIGTIGNPVVVESSNFAIKNVALIKQQDKLQNSFLSQYLKSQAVLKQFGDMTVGNTQKFIALGKLRQLKIQLPSKSEQIKIANFLAAIDDKITKTQAELDAVKQYKQGLLQQMFV